MNFDTFLQNVIGDLRVELTDEFDRNFERKAFFDKPWAPIRGTNNRGSLMMRSGALRGSIQDRADSSGIHWTSSLPYAVIHNEGGELTVTTKMKKFFWAMHLKAAGAVTKTKKGAARNTQRNATLSAEAENWKALALMKVGSKIKIPQRQFIGHHPRVDAIVQEVADRHVQELANGITNALKIIIKSNIYGKTVAGCASPPAGRGTGAQICR